MHRAEYMDYHLSVYRYITRRDEERFEKIEAWDAALADWENDTAGLGALHYDAFFDSVFELADLHTASTRAKEYEKFVKKLAKGVTRPDAAAGRGRRKWRHTWPRDALPAVGSHHDWLRTAAVSTCGPPPARRRRRRGGGEAWAGRVLGGGGARGPSPGRRGGGDRGGQRRHSARRRHHTARRHRPSPSRPRRPRGGARHDRRRPADARAAPDPPRCFPSPRRR